MQKLQELRQNRLKPHARQGRAAETAPERWITPLNACKTDTERHWKTSEQGKTPILSWRESERQSPVKACQPKPKPREKLKVKALITTCRLLVMKRQETRRDGLIGCKSIRSHQTPQLQRAVPQSLTSDTFRREKQGFRRQISAFLPGGMEAPTHSHGHESNRSPFDMEKRQSTIQISQNSGMYPRSMTDLQRSIHRVKGGSINTEDEAVAANAMPSLCITLNTSQPPTKIPCA